MSPDDRKMVEELRRRGDAVSVRAADRFETYFRMDCEAAEHVESVIVTRTDFSGDPPYVGWKGLGLALNEALDERDKLGNQCDKQETALHRIEQWSQAYPLTIFRKPDYPAIHAALAAAGLTLDAVSADCMRHVVEGVGRIAREALSSPAAVPQPAMGDDEGEGR